MSDQTEPKRLVERLRNPLSFIDAGGGAVMADEALEADVLRAADRIESLVAENLRLRKALRQADGLLSEVTPAEYDPYRRSRWNANRQLWRDDAAALLEGDAP